MAFTDWLLKYYPLIVLGWTILFTVLAFVLHRTYAKRDDHISLKNEVNKMKVVIDELPNAKEIHALEIEIERLRGDIKAIEPSLLSVKHLSDILLENELLGKKDK